MNMLARRMRASAVAAALCLSAAVPGLAFADPMRIAFGDIATVESLHLLAALERAKEKGVDVQVTFLKSEDIAAQAVVSGQADIGIGGPYALLQKVKAPIRIFLQLSKLQFYPVVNTEFYKEWKDLNGQEVAVHSRGSGTEAIMQLMADKNGIAYSNISYVPGAEVRTGALLQGNVKATIVDSSGKRILEKEAPGKFAFLPLGEVAATDEALFANTDYLSKNQKDVEILVESILTTWREVAADPTSAVALREKYKLLPDATPDMVADIDPYFAEAAPALPLNGGGEDAAKDDFDFYTISGALEGNAADLKVEDFWDLTALNAVLAKIGTK
ncbi:ABC transporter substrate-binding protein [Shinella sp. HZN7]|jgi:NitT/TauT family transport system substrate-binding protein|uniref:NitT/TauT family transport system substrate-binding protein n=2 Tax=Shinella granuli TaxID=323621 RepID=A0A4R2CW09_SHIGR|nr:ABC transporter substrate-binding protein [Shinella sp. HZN7]ANH08325.1 nitrate ABC transporter substrate-binding protein [Shinella sp. HZN7]TCN43569.1 NitT/TauT family transport system substrate-binding protein [Shinella granuli]